MQTVALSSRVTSQLSSNLSKRELEVLRLIADGYSNTEIGALLYLSHNTIKTHVRGILNKFGVDHRIQAVVLAMRLGLL